MAGNPFNSFLFFRRKVQFLIGIPYHLQSDILGNSIICTYDDLTIITVCGTSGLGKRNKKSGQGASSGLARRTNGYKGKWNELEEDITIPQHKVLSLPRIQLSISVNHGAPKWA
jgi:hypothetical protein